MPSRPRKTWRQKHRSLEIFGSRTKLKACYLSFRPLSLSVFFSLGGSGGVNSGVQKFLLRRNIIELASLRADSVLNSIRAHHHIKILK